MDTTLSAQRRNLMLTSIGFVVYTLGDGNIKDELSLPIGIELSNPEVLVLAAWLCLFWFYWRYWVYVDAYAQNEVISKYHKYIKQYYSQELNAQAAKKAPVNDNVQIQMWQLDKSNFGGGLWSWAYTIVGVDERGRAIREEFKGVQEKWYEGFGLKLRSYLSFSFQLTHFGDLIVPHLMFLAALFSGALCYVKG